jgi:hypothetical protein
MHARVKQDVDVLTLPVHPAADVFPMLDDDELSELANDIAENGLLQPIVIAEVDGEMMVIDGRNRRAACKLVNVEPAVQLLPPDVDLVDYIESVGLRRRDLTKGQKAIIAALLRPDVAKGGRGNKLYSENTVSRQLLSYARTVLRFAPDMADGVRAGAVSLNDAYQTAQQRKHASEGEEARFARLKAAAPELATEVAEGRLTLQGAEAEWAERKARVRVQQVALSKNIATFRLFDSNTATDHHLDEVASVLISAPDVFREAAGLTVDEYLSAITKIIERGHLILKRVKG